VSVDDKDLSTKFTKLDINKGNYCSRLDDDDDSDDYPDDNNFASHKWVVRATAPIAKGEDPMVSKLSNYFLIVRHSSIWIYMVYSSIFCSISHKPLFKRILLQTFIMFMYSKFRMVTW